MVHRQKLIQRTPFSLARICLISGHQLFLSKPIVNTILPPENFLYAYALNTPGSPLSINKTNKIIIKLHLLSFTEQTIAPLPFPLTHPPPLTESSNSNEASEFSITLKKKASSFSLAQYPSPVRPRPILR